MYGEVDDDTYETTSIEASSIYVENLGTYFYANPSDEEEFVDIDVTPTPVIVIGDLSVTGTVTSVDGNEFTIDSGGQEMTVDTTLMLYDPTDDEGYQQIDEGDLVSVVGNIETDTFESRELMAETIVVLEDNSGSANS
ncbi:hypothetical protein LGR51_21190 [Pseudomonas sp. NP21570]|uniref:hypothetical protein n=1 Tax=Stutzerimonas kunmingensis TaxID=1211807 RepID=UPI001E617245|nr:hypothetical protein [Stutzerimonas kunmingensis]MCB4797013.1 hypothetical protein [Pseudomonas sp. NP21570]